jgi:hypothetical protein
MAEFRVPDASQTRIFSWQMKGFCFIVLTPPSDWYGLILSKKGFVAKQILLASVIEDYKGPTIYLDFDANGAIVGIEFLFD